MSFAIQVGERKNGMGDATENSSRYTWRNFVKRTWIHLAVAFTIFAIVLGIGMYSYLVLGQWQGLLLPPLPPICVRDLEV
jgi:preprotein translocase subunit SecG